MRGKTPAQKVENVFTYLLRGMVGPGKPLQDFDVQPFRRMDDTLPPNDPRYAAEDRENPPPAQVCDIKVNSCKVVFELDDEWEAEVEIIPRVQMDDKLARILDGVVSGIADLLTDPDGIKELINYPNDNRPEKDFMLVDCYQTAQDADNSDRFYRESFRVLVKFRADDGQGALT